MGADHVGVAGVMKARSICGAALVGVVNEATGKYAAH